MRKCCLLNQSLSRYHLRRTSPWFKPVSVSTAFVFICAQLTTALPVLAGPTGGAVVGGQGSIDQQGLNTTVNQHSNRLAVDWKTFDVAENESVQFVQPGRNSIVLNRIHDQKASEIHGRIDANGNVLLINTRGVIFGRSAVVNVGGLVASALDIDPNEFMNNTSVQFSAMENAYGLVVKPRFRS